VRVPMICRFALVSVLVVASAVPATAQASSTEAPDDADRQDVAERRSAVETELALLRSSDVELKARLSALDAEIAGLSQRMVAADQELADLDVRLDGLHAELAVVEQRAAEQHERLVARAVAAYMDPHGQVSMSILGSADLANVGTRKVLLDQVAERDRAVLDDSLRVEAELRAARAETAEAELRTSDVRAALAADTDDRRAKRAQQAEVRQALDTRIGEFEREASALAAEESNLVALLAARAAVAPPETTTTTTAPTTTSTTRPPTTTTTTRPGSPTTIAPSTTAAPEPAPDPTTTTTTTTAPRPTTTFVWPTPGPVTSPFGWRWGRMHRGIDIGAPMGQPIVAGGAGTVFFAGVLGGYGNLILIDHGNGIVTAYAHMTSFAVGQGARVSAGTVIGYVGSTGNSTGPHLHFEVRVGDTAVDPMPYLR